MLNLVQKWFGTTLSKPRVPAGETKDLLALAGWTKATGEASFNVRQDNVKNDTHNPVATSCGDVLAAMLRLWKSGFVAAFAIGTPTLKQRTRARARGYYVEANGSNEPMPGDILVLRNGVGPQTAGTIGHVDILSTSTEVTPDGRVVLDDRGRWRRGPLPDQSAASLTARRVERDGKNIPILVSPTDGREAARRLDRPGPAPARSLSLRTLSHE